ncbi:urease accessory protein UreF [Haloquadratum walsbyi]|uniref:Urease accessory protein UreF n=1 Tax=Haloquadratum walsbyi J07HQW2 TaxID=1238425 RepID=U1NFF0_9EURY|nr:urease accessory UreF family protein [Haloquadratum walsbyi]ERG95800.1 MAG: urease accessory protein UreF [Haloquadratum walsbyi J07HQW2]
MTEMNALLTAMRLSDSMLPVGTYTASYGIEQYLNEGSIDTPEELGNLIEGYLHGVIGPAEIVALGHAYRSAMSGDLDAIIAADERLGAATLPAEFRNSSTKAGGKLLELLDDIDSDLLADTNTDTETGGSVSDYTIAYEEGQTAGHLPVALGVVCQASGLGCRETALVSAYSSVTGLLGAAQRLGRFGHTAIQAQLSNLFPVIENICTEYHDDDLRAMYSFAPMVDVMGMNHERADRRLFSS